VLLDVSKKKDQAPFGLPKKIDLFPQAGGDPAEAPACRAESKAFFGFSFCRLGSLLQPAERPQEKRVDFSRLVATDPVSRV